MLVQSDPPGGGELAKALVDVRSALQPELMRQCLEHPAASVRQWAVDLVRNTFSPAEALTFAERLLHDPDVEVRARALIQMVWRLHPEDHQRNLALIAQVLADSQVEIRRSAAIALFYPQLAPCVPLAPIALVDSDDQVKGAAALALAAVARGRPEVPDSRPIVLKSRLPRSNSMPPHRTICGRQRRARVEWGGEEPQPEAQLAATPSAVPAALAPPPLPASPPAPVPPETPTRDGGGF